MATKRNKAWFFTTSGDSKIANFWTRFVGGGVSKPTQSTFEDLLESVPVFAEEDSAAGLDSVTDLEDKQGLVVLATDTQVKNLSSQPSGRSIVVQPHQSTTLSNAGTTTDNITNNVSNYEGAALSASVTAVATRNDYVVNLSSSFKTWLASVLNTLDAAIDSAVSSISSLVTLTGQHTHDISTINTSLNGKIENGEDSPSATGTASVFQGKVGTNLRFRKILSGTGIALFEQTHDVQIVTACGPIATVSSSATVNGGSVAPTISNSIKVNPIALNLFQVSGTITLTGGTGPFDSIYVQPFGISTISEDGIYGFAYTDIDNTTQLLVRTNSANSRLEIVSLNPTTGIITAASPRKVYFSILVPGTA